MSISAAEIMTAPAIVVGRNTSLADIAGLLTIRKISAVPVCGPDQTLLGIVSEADILKPFRESIRDKRDWWLGALAQGEDLPPAFLD
jgi:predicted transcriptional regulator